jgi:cytosine/adenosine deaminase-related metal-dependent hydrolase
MMPGFVQTHIHLCQTIFRGLADTLELLDWLALKIYPLEHAHTDRSMEVSALLGIAELVSSGTTTIMDMGSIHHEEAIVRAVRQAGLRACLGKSLMDLNPSFPAMREETRDALDSALEEARAWHGSEEGRIRYAVAPRFVLSCSEELLRGAWAMAQEHDGMLFHTHAAENRSEMGAVRERCGVDNVEYLERCEVLGPKTCLAHAIWLNEREFELLAERDARVLHCPSSNLKLGSGVAQIPRMREMGITVSLGADGAPCNNSLTMFEEMRLAALIQKPAHGPAAMPATEVLAMATIGGARALGLGDQIGSVEPGKAADLLLLDLQTVGHPLRQDSMEDLASAIVHSGSAANVHSVMVDGQWLYRGREFLRLDPAAIVHAGKTELAQLLGRAPAP